MNKVRNARAPRAPELTQNPSATHDLQGHVWFPKSQPPQTPGPSKDVTVPELDMMPWQDVKALLLWLDSEIKESLGKIAISGCTERDFEAGRIQEATRLMNRLKTRSVPENSSPESR